MKLMDKRTVRCTLKKPDGTILDALGQYIAGIVPVGYSPTAVGKANPNIGTGPYKVQSFTPGQQSVHVRNPNYWRTGQPYFDKVMIIDFPDDTARVNALLGGQIDAMTDVPAGPGRGRQRPFGDEGAGVAECGVDADLHAGRRAAVQRRAGAAGDAADREPAADGGAGAVGSRQDRQRSLRPFDEAFAKSLPQRAQDIDKAKSLLKAAGQEGLTVDLQSTNGALGMNEGAQVFAQQAKAAGVTINVKILDSGAFYGDQYLKWPFSTDFWGSRNYLSQVAAAACPRLRTTRRTGPRTRSSSRSTTRHVVTTDRTKQAAIIQEMQKMEYDTGGYIVWGFSTLLDGYSTKVQGLKQGDKGVLPMNAFGHGYRTIWFA